MTDVAMTRTRASFSDVLATLPLDDLARSARDSSDAAVDRALSTAPERRDLADLAALLSPRASRRLEELAHESRALTQQRFGRTVHLYAPIYLSNECLTTCTYCGFAKDLEIRRRTLSTLESVREARALAAQGFRHLLLLTGEHKQATGVGFLCEHLDALRSFIPQLSLEVQVLDTPEYEQLVAAGCDGVVAYQETYDQARYAEVHVAGVKRRFGFRLDGPERAAAAGVRRLGIGALLGLHDDWRFDVLATVAHARHLQRAAWRAELAVSVPRIRPSASGFQPRTVVGDRDLAQIVCALRLMLPEAGIVASSREEAGFRDRLVPLGVTHTSAGSHTEPGGYTEPGAADEQFEVNDTRSVVEVGAALRALGYDLVWKDWDAAMRHAERSAERELAVAR
jgi:2-iminoacetate synthase